MTDSRRDRLTWESGLKEEISERPRREREKPDPPALPAWLTWITDDRLIVRPTLNEEISDRPGEKCEKVPPPQSTGWRERAGLKEEISDRPRGRREKPDPSAMIGLPSERPGEKREKVPPASACMANSCHHGCGCTLPRTQYCSPDCQKQDWKNHRTQGREIKKSKQTGKVAIFRYVERRV